MKCREVKELLVAYLDKEVTPSEREMIEAHLAKCASCQKELEYLAGLQCRFTDSLRAIAANAVPSPQAWSRLQARLTKRAPRKPWPQRLAPSVWHKMTTKGGEVLMKHKFALATIVTLVLAISVVAFVPSVRAQVGEVISRWFRIEFPGGEVAVEMRGPFTPLHPTYLPTGLRVASVTSGKVKGEPEAIELAYHNEEQFVDIVQTKAPTGKPLPAGREVVVNGQPGVLITGLSGTFKAGPDIPEEAIEEKGVIGTPPATPVHFRLEGISIPYDDGKRLVWYAGDVKVEMLSNLPEEEMLKVAESMMPAEAGEGKAPFELPLNLPSGGEEKAIETEGGRIIIQEGPIETNP